MPAEGARGAGRAWAAVLALLVAVHGWLLVSSPRVRDYDFDPEHLYLPLARAFSAQGWSFFLDERSLQAPPLTFLWVALHGGDLEGVRTWNGALSVVTLLLIARTASLAFSPAAGLAAAAIFVLSPLMRPFLLTAGTEPLYFLFCAVWAWGWAEWCTGRRAAMAWIGAAGMLAATLTRAPLFYGNVMLVLALLAATLAGRAREWRPLLLPATVALAIPLLLAAKNAWLFGFPFFVTGGGNALYLGNNPLTGGYDPNYLGLAYDVGAVLRGPEHLTVAADRLLKAATGLIVGDKGLPFLAGLHLRKALAFVFVTAAEPEAPVLRAWRAAMVLAAGWGLWSSRRSCAGWIVGAALVFHFAIHVPVLYTHRYSVDALDLWLVIAAGVGIAAAWRSPWRGRALAVAALAIVAGIAAASVSWLGRPMPDVFAVPRWQVWESGPRVASLDRELALPIDHAPWFRWFNNHVIVIDAAYKPSKSGLGCRAVLLSFAPPGGSFSPPRRVALPAARGRVQVGALDVPASQRGVLRIQPACPAGGELEVANVAVYAALGALDYGQRLAGIPSVMPMER